MKLYEVHPTVIFFKSGMQAGDAVCILKSACPRFGFLYKIPFGVGWLDTSIALGIREN